MNDNQHESIERLTRQAERLQAKVELLNAKLDEHEADQPSLFGTLIRVAGLLLFGYWLGGGFSDD